MIKGKGRINLVDMRSDHRTILLFSFEPWGGMWFSKHHYAAELARDHTVYFISPPDKWRFRDLFSFKLKLTRTSEGVIVVEYRNHLPLRLLPPFLAKWIQHLTARKLGSLLQPDGNLLWCFHPTPLMLQRVLRTKGTRSIYHVVDPYQTFTMDLPCARAADLVVAVNPWFLDHYRKLNPNIVLIPHGVRSTDRVLVSQRARTYRNKWNPYVVMAGGINQRLDYELLIATARRLPELHLVLAGVLSPLAPPLDTLRNQLLAMPNVTHAGVFTPDELCILIEGSVAGLVAYPFEAKQDQPAHPYGSLKPLTYLSQLKPVITTINCYIPELAGKGVCKVEDRDEFIEAVQQAMDGRLTVDTVSVESYLDQMTYGKLIRKILHALPISST